MLDYEEQILKKKKKTWKHSY